MDFVLNGFGHLILGVLWFWCVYIFIRLESSHQILGKLVVNAVDIHQRPGECVDYLFFISRIQVHHLLLNSRIQVHHLLFYSRIDIYNRVGVNKT